MRNALLLPVFAAALVAAGPAAAQLTPPGGGDCEESPDGCGPPPPPAKPTLPQKSEINGLYRLYDNSRLTRVGFVENSQTTVENGGPFHDIGGDGTVRDGITGASVTLRGTPAPDATSTTTAHNETGQTALADLFVNYLVEIHAANGAAFAALIPFLGTSGAIAHINGNFSQSASGNAISQVVAYTGTELSDNSIERAFNAGICDYTGAFDTTGSNCRAGSYMVDLNFRTGDSFTNGRANSIYGSIVLLSTVSAGYYGGGAAGDAAAFIDPTITLNPLFNNPLYSLSTGNQVQLAGGAGAVPEPAAWALMVVGFGAVGGLARRQRPRVVTA